MQQIIMNYHLIKIIVLMIENQFKSFIFSADGLVVIFPNDEN